jgi:hypothetical protein
MAINSAVNIDINVDGTTTVKQAAEAVENLGDKYSDAQKKAEELALAKGLDNKETQEAIRLAGKYKGELEQLDFAIDAAKGGSDQLFRASQGIVAGFEVAAGAAAIFGGESEELEKILIKVQGAMALSQGLKDFNEFLPAIQNVAKGFSGVLTKAVQGFSKASKIALASTGVGALIVAVGLLIEYWDDLKSALSGVTAEQAALNETQEDYNKSVATTTKQVKEVGTAFELAKAGVISKEEALFQYNETLGDVLGRANSIEEAEQNYIDKTDAYIKATALRKQAEVLLEKAAQAQADALTTTTENSLSSLDEFILGTQKGFAKIIDYSSAGLTNLSGSVDKFSNDLANAKANDIKTEKKYQADSFTTLAEGLLKEATEIEKTNDIKSKSNENFRKKQEEDRKKNQEAAQKAAEEQRKLAEAQAEQNKFVADEQAKANEVVGRSLANSITSTIKPFEMVTLEFEKQATRQMGFFEKLGKAAVAYGEEIGNSVGQGLDVASQLAEAFAGEDEERQRKAFELSKKLRIAQVIMSSVQGVQDAFTTANKSPLAIAFPPYPYIQASLAAAFGLAQIKQISNQQYKSTKAPSVNTGGGGGAVARPGVPQLNAPRLQSTLNADNQLFSERRVYVTESDITTTQKKVATTQKVSLVE